MRLAAVLLVAFAYSSAFDSEPGTPLDCEDWIGVVPGLSFAEDEGVAFGALLATATDRVALDNEGGRIIIGGASTLTPPTPCGAGGLPLVRATTGNALEVLACVGSRQNPVAGYSDSAIQWNSGCYYPTPAPAGGCVRFNPITGDLFFSFLRMGTGYADSPIWCVMHGLTMNRPGFPGDRFS